MISICRRCDARVFVELSPTVEYLVQPFDLCLGEEAGDLPSRVELDASSRIGGDMTAEDRVVEDVAEGSAGSGWRCPERSRCSRRTTAAPSSA